MILLILAKSNPDETLMEHTENTLKVFKSIKFNYPNIPKLCDVPNFWEYLFYTLFFHDFGKAATGFQDSLNKDSFWNYRHEILSACFVACLKDEVPEIYRKAIALGIITHHKDVHILRERYQTKSSEGERVYLEKLNELKTNFDELISYLDLVSDFSEKYLGYSLKVPNKLSFNDLENVYKTTVLPYFLDAEDEEYNELHSILGIFLKGFTNACDYLASGGNYNILSGINDLKQIYNFESLRKIQEISSKTKGSTFLIAPTGSGKTEASLLWTNYNQNENSTKRVFYFLPYTASINAMYKRLVKDFNNESLVGLLHGKSSYFLYKSFEDLNYNEAKIKVKNVKGLTNKIYRPYKALTPFQIIKYFFGVKGFEMGLSELANSLIILDEIHAYDAYTAALFLEILKILKNDFGASIFIMSATLPSFLLNIFKNELNIDNLISFDNNELDNFTRHEVNILDGCIEDYLDYILLDIKNNKKVLVVCNTVKKSQYVFNWFKSKGLENISLLHSKFILKDRESIEKNLSELDLLVGTQAIEVSLDISYDVLYTEPAPLDALIQRFGRVNRVGWKDNIIKPVNVFSLGSNKDKHIYNMDIVEKTLNVLRDESILFESKIQKLLDDVYSDGYDKTDQKIFDTVKNTFCSYYNSLVPFINQKDSENLFSKLFDSYEVVPQKFKNDYLNRIKNREYFEAMSYNLSLTVKQFNKLRNEDNVEYVEDTFFINCKYDSKLGLLIDEEEDNIL